MSTELTWPPLPLASWRDTCETLHMYAQVIGKIRLALTPVEPEWANVPLIPAARGLTTGAIPYGDKLLEIDLDFFAHAAHVRISDGTSRAIALLPALCVADFYERVMAALRALGVDVRIWPRAVEVPNAIDCSTDRTHDSYDPDAVQRFWTVMAGVVSAFSAHRAPFRGRHTPLQFFWGTFDLAYVRYSGRPASPPPNADAIMRVAMDAEEIAAGFWPGDDRFPEPAFFCYAYPKPPELERARIGPASAFWSETMGEFVLRYEDVRTAPSPRAAILEFLSTSYDAAATLARWNRDALGGEAAAQR